MTLGYWRALTLLQTCSHTLWHHYQSMNIYNENLLYDEFHFLHAQLILLDGHDNFNLSHKSPIRRVHALSSHRGFLLQPNNPPF